MKTEQEIKDAIVKLRQKTATNQVDKTNRRHLLSALQWVLGEITLPCLDTA